jgi:hypothetical protein
MTIGARRSMLILLVAVGATHAGVKVSPLLNAEIRGGDALVAGRRTGIKGSADVDFTPVLEFSDRLALLPTLRSRYAGHQSAVQLVDDRALFQQEQSHGGEMTILYRPRPAWKIIVRGGAQWTYLQETADETWGRGLYDHRDLFTGIHGERERRGRRRPDTWRWGIEFGHTLFPRATALGTTDAPSAAGTFPLDSHQFRGSAQWSAFLTPTVYVQNRLILAQIRYADQKISREGGRFTRADRRDVDATLQSQWEYSRAAAGLPWSAGLPLSVRRLRSNQSYFDPENYEFIRNYFDFVEPALRAMFRVQSGVTRLALTGTISRRFYDDRRAQRSDRSYTAHAMYVQDHNLSLDVSRPLARHLRAIGSVERHWAASNNRYETFYRYRFTAQTYNLGLALEF